MLIRLFGLEHGTFFGKLHPDMRFLPTIVALITFQSYGTDYHFYARGRALEDESIDLEEQHIWHLIVNTWKRFETDEIKHVGLDVKLPNNKIIKVKTDDSGYFIAEENIEKTIPNNPGILSHGIDFYLKVKGDSMIEVGIFENDLIAINKNLPIKAGSIVVARINDEVTVKTLEKISTTQVILRSENSSYSNIEVNPKKENLVFEGTCVGLLRDFS